MQPLSAYVLNNMADGEPLFVGKVRADGRWLIQRFTASSTMEYANPQNNAGVGGYTAAWTARAALTYVPFEQLIDY